MRIVDTDTERDQTCLRTHGMFSQCFLPVKIVTFLNDDHEISSHNSQAMKVRDARVATIPK